MFSLTLSVKAGGIMLLFHLRVLTGISTFDVTAYITDFPFHVPKIKIFN